MAIRRRRGPREVVAFASAFPVVCLVRLALWFVPSRVLLRCVAGLVRRAEKPARVDAGVVRVGWAVRAAARRIPAASCLTQALSAQVLLAARGLSSELKIGVTLDSNRQFSAHAWVLVDGKVLVGGRETRRFTEFPDLTIRL